MIKPEKILLPKAFSFNERIDNNNNSFAIGLFFINICLCLKLLMLQLREMLIPGAIIVISIIAILAQGIKCLAEKNVQSHGILIISENCIVILFDSCLCYQYLHIHPTHTYT